MGGKPPIKRAPSMNDWSGDTKQFDSAFAGRQGVTIWLVSWGELDGLDQVQHQADQQEIVLGRHKCVRSYPRAHQSPGWYSSALRWTNDRLSTEIFRGIYIYIFSELRSILRYVRTPLSSENKFEQSRRSAYLFSSWGKTRWQLPIKSRVNRETSLW